MTFQVSDMGFELTNNNVYSLLDIELDGVERLSDQDDFMDFDGVAPIVQGSTAMLDNSDENMAATNAGSSQGV